MRRSRKDVVLRLSVKDQEFEELLRRASRVLSESSSTSTVTGKVLLEPSEPAVEEQGRFGKD